MYDELDRVDGPPTDPQNLQRYLEVGTLLCEIGDPETQVAVASVSASQVGLLEVGQTATLHCRQWPGRRLAGRVEQVSAMDFSASTDSTRLASTPSADTKSKRHIGGAPDTSLTYQVRIALQHEAPLLRLDSPAVARVTVRSQSLGQRWWRYVRTHLR